MLDTKNVRITCLTLLAACQCNLACSYCPIARTVNSKTAAMMDANVKALQDGTYLKNAERAIRRLNASPLQIDSMQIWGQEPTLILQYLTQNWEEWTKVFPNLTYFMFSTNGMEHTQDILDFILAIEKYTTKKFQITIQVSYDGVYGTEEARGGKSTIIRNNFIWLAQQLNTYKLKKTHVELQGHGVFSIELANWLDSFDKMDEYVSSIDQLLLGMEDTICNRDVSWASYAVQFQTGGSVSTEDGLRYYNALKRFEQLNNRGNYRYYRQSPGAFIQVMGACLKNLADCFLNSPYETFDEYVNAFIAGNTPEIQSDLHCSTTLQDLKLTYDGSALLCQNDIFNSIADDEDFSDDIFGQSHRYYFKHGHRVNLITDSDEKIQHFLDYVVDIRDNGSRFVHSSLCNILFILAQTGQIDASYSNDLNKIKRHAFMLMFLDSCYNNAIAQTGSVFLRDVSFIRLLSNGILDEAEKILHKDTMLKNKNPIMTIVSPGGNKLC